MRNLIALVALIAAPQLAAAQTPSIVDACAAATAHYYNVDDVLWSEPQAFPELDPPRVQFRVKIPEGVSPPGTIGRLIFGSAAPAEQETYIVRCEFERSEAPFGLTNFTPPPGSFDDGSRLEELQALLSREGF